MFTFQARLIGAAVVLGLLAVGSAQAVVTNVPCAQAAGQVAKLAKQVSAQQAENAKLQSDYDQAVAAFNNCRASHHSVCRGDRRDNAKKALAAGNATLASLEDQLSTAKAASASACQKPPGTNTR